MEWPAVQSMLKKMEDRAMSFTSSALMRGMLDHF
jgi:hypothetical protein